MLLLRSGAYSTWAGAVHVLRQKKNAGGRCACCCLLVVESGSVQVWAEAVHVLLQGRGRVHPLVCHPALALVGPCQPVHTKTRTRQEEQAAWGPGDVSTRAFGVAHPWQRPRNVRNQIMWVRPRPKATHPTPPHPTLALHAIPRLLLKVVRVVVGGGVASVPVPPAAFHHIHLSVGWYRASCLRP